MTATSTKHDYWSGVRSGLPDIVLVVPFATLFGVVAIEAALTLA
jgi:predicted branched-subunit amino acid permease